LTITSTLFAVATCSMCCILAGLLVIRPGKATTILEARAREADSNKLVTRTTLVSEAGQNELRVETTDGFCSGDRVSISSDRADEYGIIRDLAGGDTMVLAAPLRCAHPAAAVISAPGGNTNMPQRHLMINNLFQALDADGNQHLSSSELLVLAELDGFQGSGEEWEEEYSKLVRKHSHAHNLGCDKWLFASLVNDRDGGLYVTDADIRHYLNVLEVR